MTSLMRQVVKKEGMRWRQQAESFLRSIQMAGLMMAAFFTLGTLCSLCSLQLEMGAVPHLRDLMTKGRVGGRWSSSQK